jgi:hypothetical protein
VRGGGQVLLSAHEEGQVAAWEALGDHAVITSVKLASGAAKLAVYHTAEGEGRVLVGTKSGKVFKLAYPGLELLGEVSAMSFLGQRAYKLPVIDTPQTEQPPAQVHSEHKPKSFPPPRPCCRWHSMKVGSRRSTSLRRRRVVPACWPRGVRIQSSGSAIRVTSCRLRGWVARACVARLSVGSSESETIGARG